MILLWISKPVNDDFDYFMMLNYLLDDLMIIM